MPRVVSLIPSATELVCALGAKDDLVGRSHECDHPQSITHLPVCTGPRFDPQGSSREIDDRVKDLLRDAVSLYRVDAQQLQALKPDCILTQAQCEVCAVSLAEVAQVVGDWIGLKPSIVSLSPNGLEDVWEDIRRVAYALDRKEEGESLVSQLQSRVEAIKTRTREIVDRLTVGCIEWLDPLMASANWMPELIDHAGGRNVLGKAGEHAPWITWEAVQQQDPDILLLLPCGFSIPRTREELHLLTNQPGWSDLKAVKEKKVFLMDGNQYFNRPGPRLVDSVEILAEIIHPTIFHFGYEGQGWERL
ncbi:MAG: cobalamin-binding protein [Nitrospirae bacterium]|nr:cobalamin-binding protein [Nitrospirota bacterium]MDA1304146.1 cobalamin-binding protein [Nitrospirota bacterium]